MDSKDFAAAVWPERTRDETDAALDRALRWVWGNAIPERVFSRELLDAWALRNGYEKRDSTALLDLLKAAQPFVVKPSQLAKQINDAIEDRTHA